MKNKNKVIAEEKEVTEEYVDKFEKILSQLEGLHSEIGALSRKAQDDAVNKFKLKFVNNVLEAANKFLGEKYKPFEEFDVFNIDDVPKNSDVTFIILQYLGCMENLRVSNIDYKQHWEGQKAVRTWFWNDIDKITYPPLNIKNK